MTRESRVHVSPSVYARVFGDEIVLLDFGRGEYFALDPIGAEIWKRLEAGEALGTIADAIAEQYDVLPDAAYRDIVELVTHLSGESLVRIAC